jgi:hypothetical protein
MDTADEKADDGEGGEYCFGFNIHDAKRYDYRVTVEVARPNGTELRHFESVREPARAVTQPEGEAGLSMPADGPPRSEHV